jgi:biopolymer transport protein TolR
MRATKHDLVQAEINLMPLIDVCLVLMIILLVVFPMMRATAAPAAKPGPGPSSGVLAIVEPRLVVAILADGSLVVDGRPVPHADLPRVLREIWSLTPNRPVVLKVDRHVRYAQVRFVFRSIYGAGFGSAGFADR